MRMTNLPLLSVDELRTHAQSILNNARSSEVISAPLAERGWTDDRLDALQGAVDAFEDAARRFSEQQAEESAASTRLNEAVDAFRRGTFRQHVDFADAVFTEDVDARALLKLDDGLGTLRPSYDAWHPMAKDFYNQILTDTSLQDAFAEYNVTVEELQIGADEVARLEGLYDRREAFNSERQQFRRERDAKREILETELRRFQKFARVIFAETPDRLERLGFTVLSDE